MGEDWVTPDAITFVAGGAALSPLRGGTAARARMAAAVQPQLPAPDAALQGLNALAAAWGTQPAGGGTDERDGAAGGELLRRAKRRLGEDAAALAPERGQLTAAPTALDATACALRGAPLLIAPCRAERRQLFAASTAGGGGSSGERALLDSAPALRPPLAAAPSHARRRVKAPVRGSMY